MTEHCTVEKNIKVLGREQMNMNLFLFLFVVCLYRYVRKDTSVWDVSRQLCGTGVTTGMFDCQWTSVLLSCIHFTQTSLSQMNVVNFHFTDTHTHTQAKKFYLAHTPTHTHTHMRARAHQHTHTRTHIDTILLSFSDSTMICMHTLKSWPQKHEQCYHKISRKSLHRSLFTACVWDSQHSLKIGHCNKGVGHLDLIQVKLYIGFTICIYIHWKIGFQTGCLRMNVKSKSLQSPSPRSARSDLPPFYHLTAPSAQTITGVVV